MLEKENSNILLEGCSFNQIKSLRVFQKLKILNINANIYYFFSTKKSGGLLFLYSDNTLIKIDLCLFKNLSASGVKFFFNILKLKFRALGWRILLFEIC